jgi:hypothetical protein
MVHPRWSAALTASRRLLRLDFFCCTLLVLTPAPPLKHGRPKDDRANPEGCDPHHHHTNRQCPHERTSFPPCVMRFLIWITNALSSMATTWLPRKVTPGGAVRVVGFPSVKGVRADGRQEISDPRNQDLSNFHRWSAANGKSSGLDRPEQSGSLTDVPLPHGPHPNLATSRRKIERFQHRWSIGCAAPPRLASRSAPCWTVEKWPSLHRRYSRRPSLLPAPGRPDRGGGPPRRHLRHQNQHPCRASRRSRNGPGLQGFVTRRTRLPIDQDRRSRNPADPPLDGTTRARPRLPVHARLPCRMAFARSPGAAFVPRHRPRGRPGRANLSGRQDRTLRGGESQEGHQALSRRSSHHELRRTHRPSRHPRAKHHARAPSLQTSLHASLQSDAPPGGRVQAPRSRPAACPVIEKRDGQLLKLDQPLVQLTNENFGLIGCSRADPRRAQRGDHLLTDLPTLTATFNDLEIGASAGGLQVFLRKHISDSCVVSIRSQQNQLPSTQISIKRGTTLSSKPSLDISNYSDLHPTDPRNCRKSVGLEMRGDSRSLISGYRSARRPAPRGCRATEFRVLSQ